MPCWDDECPGTFPVAATGEGQARCSVCNRAWPTPKAATRSLWLLAVLLLFALPFGLYVLLRTTT